MELTINGQKESCPNGISVAEMLRLREHDPQRVVVELNGNIVPAGAFVDTPLQDGDAIEIVQFVGGG